MSISNRTLCSADRYGIIKIWDADKVNAVKTIDTGSVLTLAQFEKDNVGIVASNENGIQVS